MDKTRRSAWSHVPVMLFGVLLLTPLIAVPASGPWTGIRVCVIQTVALALLALLLVKSTWSSEAFKRFIITGPYLAVILLVTWAALSFVLTAPSIDHGRGIALVEFMRLFWGAVIYFAAVFFCRSRNHLRLASLVLLIGCIAVAVAGLLSFSFTSKEYITAGFGDNQLLGALLTGLLPLAVVLAVSPATRGRRLIAWVATVLVACALLMTGNRSGWLGGVVGLLVVAMLAHRAGMMRLSGIRGRVRQKRTALLAAGTALVLISSCFVLSGAGTMVLDRARTLTTLSTDGSVALRLQTWRISGEMLLERPLTGWGLGSFPLKFGEFYVRGGGDQTRYPVPSAAQVQNKGVGLSSMAHNEYLQLATELGLVGLALYLAVLGGFFHCGIRAFRQMPTGTRRWLLLATLGAVAAQCVDGLANPGWRFADVSPLLWLLLGLGMAAARPQREPHPAPGLQAPNGRRLRRLRPVGQVVAAVLVTIVVAAAFTANVRVANGQPTPRYIRVDANRDDHISFEDDSDQTTAAKPYRFWLNNDRDLVGVYEADEQDDAKPDSGPPDSADLDIASDRDLEDFTRLHLKAPDDFDPNSPLWRCTLQFTSGTPVINVFEAVAPGIEYLIEENTAAAQRAVFYRKTVSSASETDVARKLFDNSAKKAYLLFEAHQAGKGTLTVRFYRGGQKVAEDQVYLDLKDIKKMYDHFTVGDTINMSVDLIPDTPTQINTAEEDAEMPDYILLVHGWRMQPWERRAFAETAFKRLWHRGYRGNFGLFSWPTEWAPGTFSGIITDPINYDRSEQKAFVSAKGLLGLLTVLNGEFPGRVRLIAHSMGNVVASEALRQYVETNPSGPIVHTYIASQAAVPAHAYDATAPVINPQREQYFPKVYAEYPDEFPFPYFGAIFAAVSNKMANYYNEQDFALGKYLLNQDFKPVQGLLALNFNVTYLFGGPYVPNQRSFYRIPRGHRFIPLRFPEDRYEIFAFAAPVFSRALGAQKGIQGPFTELVDLQQEFSFGSAPPGHSAQFRSTFWRRYRYWDSVLKTFGF